MTSNRAADGAETHESGETPLTPQQQAKWCKVFCPKTELGQEYYFTNSETGESVWDEPSEEYWLWDYATGAYHVSGLQKPTSKEKRKARPALSTQVLTNSL